MSWRLVTGGAGFIGSHLSTQLLSEGHKVLCVDNLSTGNKENIESLLISPQFLFIKGDVTDEKILSKIAKYQISHIYHLASPAHVEYVTKYPVETALVNTLGTNRLLEIARKKKIPLLFASSSESYGDALEHPQKETYWGNVNPVGVRSGYDEGKRFGEALCMAYKREFGVKTIIIRIFNTYGPNSSIRDSRVIPQFIQAALQGKPINIHGDGTQTRSFCYVDDLVEGIKKAMDYGQSGPYNLGNTEEYTIQAIAEKIIGATASKSKIKYTARPQDDPGQRKPDLTTTEKDLQWQARVSFDKGLEETVSYYKNIL